MLEYMFNSIQTSYNVYAHWNTRPYPISVYNLYVFNMSILKRKNWSWSDGSVVKSMDCSQSELQLPVIQLQGDKDWLQPPRAPSPMHKHADIQLKKIFKKELSRGALGQQEREEEAECSGY